MALRSIFRKSSKPRVMVVGLDGVPHSLVERFCDEGVFTFLAGLRKAGALARMKVTLPEISAVSWPSFMTGTDPGTHGIFGFSELKPGTYDLRFTSFADLKTPTFWDRLGEAGKRSVVINQPGTYPARDIPGAIVSGFVAIDLMKAVRPMRNLAALRRINYEIDIDTQRCRRDHKQLFVELDSTLDARRKAVDHFWEGADDWDYFQVVVTGTDRLQHYIWAAIEDRNHPRHQQTLDYYHKVDAFIKDMWEKFAKETKAEAEGENFFILSDHGFCGIKQEVNLNFWLRENGYLSFTSDNPKGLEDIDEGTRAFALDPSRIYLHLEGRYPRGSVKPEEVDGLKREIREKLMGLEFEGEKVLEAVMDRDEIYHGPEAQNGPDMVAVAHHGFDLKAAPAAKDLFTRTDLTGMHTWDDAFFWSREPVKQELYINDLAEIVTSPLK
jgi:predicted AlkP superfamily phosphohydrolase/phosphomutase